MEVPVFMCNFKDNLSFCSMETYQESASHLPSNWTEFSFTVNVPSTSPAVKSICEHNLMQISTSST